MNALEMDSVPWTEATNPVTLVSPPHLSELHFGHLLTPVLILFLGCSVSRM